jgi:hypothetical protein
MTTVSETSTNSQTPAHCRIVKFSNCQIWHKKSPASLLFLPDNPTEYMKKFSLFQIVVFLFLVFLFTPSCSPEVKAPDVSNINVSLDTHRFDEDFFAMDTARLGESLKKLHEKYPDFLNYYLDTFMAFGIKGNYSDTGLAIRKLDTFLTYKDFVGLEDTVKKYFPDTKPSDAALTLGFKYLKYYYPNSSAPRILYVNSGLSSWPCFPIDPDSSKSPTICVGLDWFLGPQFPYYRSVGVPDYMLSHVTKSYLPVSVFSTIYKVVHPFITDDRTLLDMMIQRGKAQYFLHKVFPAAPDSVLFGFTNLQLKWCATNEALIYNFFIHQGLLYSKDVHNTQPYITDGPYAVGLEETTDQVKVSPGNVGEWLGYKIVCNFMALHPGLSLSQLTDRETDPATFLSQANYRPKEKYRP